MSTFDTKTREWDKPRVTHDDIRAVVGKGKLTTTSDGLIIFDKELTPEDKAKVEQLLLEKRL